MKMAKPKNLIDAIGEFLKILITDPDISAECRKTARKLLSKIKEATDGS
jgi:hypothetical protein